MRYLLFFTSFIFSISSFAATDATCINENCLQWGWTKVNWMNGYRQDIRCAVNGCQLGGWTVTDNTGAYGRVSCREKGCFTEGYAGQVFSRSGNVGFSVVCSAEGCFKGGWTEYNSSIRVPVVSVCEMKDCAHYGWRFMVYDRVYSVRCKFNDCFRYGWTVNDY